MLKKGILGTLFLATAAGGPVAYFGAPDAWKAVRPEWLSLSQPETAQNGESDPLQEDPVARAPVLRVEGAPVQDLAEILRFDVTSGWVLRRWPRVSTGLAELQLQGYRVPLVTGTSETDLAGSLTYYFNAQQQVQRISFRGTTGDARKLIGLLTTRYKFSRRLTNDPGLFIYEAARPGGEPNSVLKIHSTPVVKSTEPNRRFEVELVVERPS